jgi:hypothetical protein
VSGVQFLTSFASQSNATGTVPNVNATHRHFSVFLIEINDLLLWMSSPGIQYIIGMIQECKKTPISSIEEPAALFWKVPLAFD